MTDITCPVCGEKVNPVYYGDSGHGYECWNINCILQGNIFTENEIMCPRPLETALRARIAELEGLLSKQAESDNNFRLVRKEHPGGNCPRCGNELITMLFCVNKSCALYTETGAEYQARIEELQAENAKIKREAIEQSEHVQREWLSPYEKQGWAARIEKLESENAALKADIAQHEWWGGGGR